MSRARILALLLYALQLSFAVGYTYGDEDVLDELTLTTCFSSQVQSARHCCAALNRASQTVDRHPQATLGVIFRAPREQSPVLSAELAVKRPSQLVPLGAHQDSFLRL